MGRLTIALVVMLGLVFVLAGCKKEEAPPRPPKYTPPALREPAVEPGTGPAAAPEPGELEGSAPKEEEGSETKEPSEEPPAEGSEAK